jgi:hypothetical protein
MAKTDAAGSKSTWADRTLIAALAGVIPKYVPGAASRCDRWAD